MNIRQTAVWAIFLLLAGLVFSSQAPLVEVPRTWDDEALASMEIPLANAESTPKHVSSDYYYRISVRPIYKSYPIYAPGKEPPRYMEYLAQQEPELVFDANPK